MERDSDYRTPVRLTLCLLALLLLVHSSEASPSQAADSLEDAVRAVFPEAASWDIEETSRLYMGVERAVLVSLPPHGHTDRVSRYWTVRCEYRPDSNGWGCSRTPPFVRLRIQPPNDAEICSQPATRVQNRSDLPEDQLLAIVDVVRHRPSLENELAAACEKVWKPRDELFDEWRCEVSIVSVAEGLIYVSRPAGLGCSSGMVFSRTCSAGRPCQLTPVRCTMACT